MRSISRFVSFSRAEAGRMADVSAFSFGRDDPRPIAMNQPTQERAWMSMDHFLLPTFKLDAPKMLRATPMLGEEA
jgi:hypothetical protein